MTDRPPPFHQISASDVWRKLESLETQVTKAITRMEAQTEKASENTARIKSLEIKVYATMAGLIAAITVLVAGVLQ